MESVCHSLKNLLAFIAASEVAYCHCHSEDETTELGNIYKVVSEGIVQNENSKFSLP